MSVLNRLFDPKCLGSFFHAAYNDIVTMVKVIANVIAVSVYKSLCRLKDDLKYNNDNC